MDPSDLFQPSINRQKKKRNQIMKWFFG